MDQRSLLSRDEQPAKLPGMREAFSSNFNEAGFAPDSVGTSRLRTGFLNDSQDSASGVLTSLGCSGLLWLMLTCAAAGFGMFSEAYFIFALGNVKATWKIVLDACTGSCESVYDAVGNTEVALIMVGMLTFGYAADLIGRRKGSISTATIMFVGAILSTAANGKTTRDIYVWMCVAIAIFGYGVGGEYPLASASAAERAEATKVSTLNPMRGMTVVLVFTMQGWGNWVNCLVFYVGTIAAGAGDCPNYKCDNATDPFSDSCLFGKTSEDNPEQCPADGLNALWRSQYGVGAVFVGALALLRFLYLKESEVWARRQRAAAEVAKARAFNDEVEAGALAKGQVGSRLSVVDECQCELSRPFLMYMMFKLYWHRLAGTALGWFVWDICFYGNKLFQSSITSDILNNPTVSDIYAFNLQNATIALVGYYFAAFTVDRWWMGRRGMQLMGFTVSAACYLWATYQYDWFRSHGTAFKIVYWVSTFFGQWGPNATTWLLPSELFPTEVRTFAHGISAMTGKAGALVATLVFPDMSTESVMTISGYSCLAGIVITLIFVSDVTELSLAENDKRWSAAMKGDVNTYGGEAVNPKHLSVWERMTGVGRAYKGPSNDELHEPLVKDDARV